MQKNIFGRHFPTEHHVVIDYLVIGVSYFWLQNNEPLKQICLKFTIKARDLQNKFLQVNNKDIGTRPLMLLRFL